MNESTRRGFLLFSTTAGASLALAACKGDSVKSEPAPAAPGAAPAKSGSAIASASASANAADKDKGKDKDKDDDEEVGAVEDLMREHGILRRALVVYREAAAKLRANAASVSPATLTKTAKLFRAFGEDYHEKKLEEAFIFPAVKRAGGKAAPLVDVLIAQHNRGRELQDYVLAQTAGPKIGAKADDLAKVLEQFARMYESHAAREDTQVFTAWKKTMKKKDLEEMGEKFEDIEKQTFGKDGFDDASDQMDGIERELGLADLAIFTAPAPPK